MKSSLTAALLAASLHLSSSASGAIAYGLDSSNSLYRFDTASPSAATLVGSLGPAFVDIDFHAANGNLYGITASGATYNINPLSGATTLLFTPLANVGTVQNFDFNPVADRMRLSSAGNANYRMVPDFITPPSAAGTVGTVVVDGTFNLPATVSILSNAYTNPFDLATTTTLYSIGSDGMLYSHFTGGGDPAGSFNSVNAVGSLGFTPSAAVGFDIDATNQAYLSDGADFYSVNLATGAATLIGTSSASLTTFAIAVPEPSVAFFSTSLSGLGLMRRRRNG